MTPPAEPHIVLACRLRELREERWPDVTITQPQLGRALGGNKALSAALVSSWENTAKPTAPPVTRLAAYATFFATRRSVEHEPYRLLPVGDLTADERACRAELLNELVELRQSGDHPVNRPRNLWRFPAEETVTIVCARLPQEHRDEIRYANPDSPDFVSLYNYADLDALIELFGHVRASNPDTPVNFRTVNELRTDDYVTHLVLLGGVDWNRLTRDVLGQSQLPVTQVARTDDAEHGGFRVKFGDGSRLFSPQFEDNGHLREDVAHFYRGVNPFNRKRTVTICNGMYGRGTAGAVRALTDTLFRDRNHAYLDSRFAGAEAFSIISRVTVIMGGQALTPDWTVAETRLHEWPDSTE